jgi:hypothetical protein
VPGSAITITSIVGFCCFFAPRTVDAFHTGTAVTGTTVTRTGNTGTPPLSHRYHYRYNYKSNSKYIYSSHHRSISISISNNDRGAGTGTGIETERRARRSNNRGDSYDEDPYDEYDDDSYAYADTNDDDDDYDYDDEYYDAPAPAPVSWEWETHGKSTHVYLPPPIDIKHNNNKQNTSRPSKSPSKSKSKSKSERPKTIIHFIGGTLFGSYPLKFYSPLLEQIATQSNSIIIATSIPITLSQNPLNHYLIAKSTVLDFNRAYREVVADEYGSSVADEMRIVGLGHSLGSRLHAIIGTSRTLSRIGWERAANVFVAFNNYNAAESVPGVKGLERGIQDTLYGSGSSGLTSTSGRRSRSRPRPDAYYDEYEIGLGDVVNAVSEGIQDQVSTLKTAITPDLDQKSLEFQPSPQQLWDGIGRNYGVKNSLVVQFDQDLIDQSSRLAKVILESQDDDANVNDAETSNGKKESGGEAVADNVDVEVDENKDENKEIAEISIQKAAVEGDTSPTSGDDKDGSDEDANPSNDVGKDVKFARLRGTHLSPVQDEDVEDLSSTIARYLTDVVIGK